MAQVNEIAVDGVTTEYIKFGSGKKTLVILPGLSIQSVIPAAPAIEKQYSVFKNDFTVYLFERRKELPENFTVYDMAQDTAKAIKALKLEDVCLFGVSQGGMIALTVAAQYPQAISKLAVCSTAAYVDENRLSVIDEWISLAEKKETEKLYISFAEKVYPENVFARYKGYFSETAKSVTNEELTRFVKLARATYGFDIRASLNSISCPLLVTGDDGDRVLGNTAVCELAELFKNNADFQSYMYHGFGHAVYDTATDYAQRLFDFFK